MDLPRANTDIDLWIKPPSPLKGVKITKLNATISYVDSQSPVHKFPSSITLPRTLSQQLLRPDRHLPCLLGIVHNTETSLHLR